MLENSGRIRRFITYLLFASTIINCWPAFAVPLEEPKRRSCSIRFIMVAVAITSIAVGIPLNLLQKSWDRLSVEAAARAKNVSIVTAHSRNIGAYSDLSLFRFDAHEVADGAIMEMMQTLTKGQKPWRLHLSRKLVVLSVIPEVAATLKKYNVPYGDQKALEKFLGNPTDDEDMRRRLQTPAASAVREALVEAYENLFSPKSPTRVPANDWHAFEDWLLGQATRTENTLRIARGESGISHTYIDYADYVFTTLVKTAEGRERLRKVLLAHSKTIKEGSLFIDSYLLDNLQTKEGFERYTGNPDGRGFPRSKLYPNPHFRIYTPGSPETSEIGFAIYLVLTARSDKPPTAIIEEIFGIPTPPQGVPTTSSH
jgi:hypothetical protein